jgi:hypothetical protein
MKYSKRATKAAEVSTSGSEDETARRTYAEVAAHMSESDTVPTPGPIQGTQLAPEVRQGPPGPPGPQRADARRSPSPPPVAGGSGLQTPPSARSVKKRKREVGEEIAEIEARKSNAFLMTEMAIISSRAPYRNTWNA